MPRILQPDQVGLLRLLISYSGLLAQIGTLGFNMSTMRLFPFFRNPQNMHYGFLALNLAVSIIGCLLILVVFVFIKPLIISYNIQEAELFTTYINYLIPIFVANILFINIDTYFTVQYNAIKGILYKDVIQRVIIIIFIILFYFNYFQFETFLILYVFAQIFPTFQSLINLARIGELKFKVFWKLPPGLELSNLLKTSFFGLFSSLSALIILQVDSIMVAAMTGLYSAGIYTITFFFGTLIRIPSRGLLKIAATFLAEAWKRNDHAEIKIIYYKSSLTQYIVGILLFIGIWGNINNVFCILTPEYSEGKYVILFIGLFNLIEMAAGVNLQIILTSVHYRMISYFLLIQIISLLIFNYIFILLWGLNGAALGSLASTLIYNILRYIFVWKKFNMQPFNIKFLYVSLIAAFAYFGSLLLPQLNNFIVDIFFRSAIISVLFVIPIIVFKISDDLNFKFFEYFNKVKNFFNRREK